MKTIDIINSIRIKFNRCGLTFCLANAIAHLVRIASGLVLATGVAFATLPPAPYGPVPTPRQLLRETNAFYGFVHFGVNTFTGSEWGAGDEDPNVFDPTNFDPDQIARTAKMAGMKCLILTCKHIDGFCLWPSKF